MPLGARVTEARLQRFAGGAYVRGREREDNSLGECIVQSVTEEALCD